MANTTYEFIPNQSVYVIDVCSDGETIAVVPGKVSRVKILITASETQLSYDVFLANNSWTKAFSEDNIFATKNDALAEYSTRLG